MNLRGEIIGINEIVFGIGGAIPGNLAKSIAGHLIKKEGMVRSWIGIEFQPLLKGSAQKRGVIVSRVIPGSPAEQSGFKAGNVVLLIANRPVDVKFPEELPMLAQFIDSLAVGEAVEITVLRDEKTLTLSAKPRVREYLQPKTREFKKWGLTARDLSFITAKEMRRPDQRGVLVTSVRPGGPAWTATPRLAQNDVIVEVEGVPIANIRELLELTNRLSSQTEEQVSVVVIFERGGERMVSLVKLGTLLHRRYRAGGVTRLKLIGQA